MAAVATQPAPAEDDKELRAQVRAQLHRVKHDRHNLTALEGGSNTLVSMVEKSNELVRNVTRPRDQAIDAEAFCDLTDAGLELVMRMRQGGAAHSAGDFLRRLRARYVEDGLEAADGAADPEAFNWAGLGQSASVTALFRTAPVSHHMLGPLDAAPRQKRQVQCQAKRKLPTGEAVRPEEVEVVEDENKQETDRNMEDMWGVLARHGGRLSVLDLVMNCQSFAQTVENMFTLSFLVRDGKVSLEPNEEEGMIVRAQVKGKVEPKERPKDEKEREQFVIPLDIDTWEMWKEAFDESKPPLMKHRKEWRQAAAAAAAERQQQEQAQQEQAQHQQEQPEPEDQNGEDEEPHGQQQKKRRKTPAQRQQEEQQEEEEQEEDDPQPPLQMQKGRRQARKQQQQQQEQQAEEEEEPEEEQPPAAKRRPSRGQPQREPLQQQQVQQQAAPRQQQQVRVKPAPSSAPRARRSPSQQAQQQVKQEPAAQWQRQQQAQQQEEEVIVISSSSAEIVIDDSSDAEFASPAASLPCTSQGTQATGRRPMRGKR
ncbi:non-structural maintenance of chromosomes element 4-like protein A [Micractinium conductrix]|uniref:Non-structural maintenance of chromosomes element 4 n=1 Tax=Micractinium conductrix TaxID=554055 RepID=A0A2P6VFA0_9CHLO|nr:non-structural maintenance of chromosomes element 4-like protein A [Micractinium conductrix]|eukprot:PSC72758.1 non-structural maintenance of chromosomes element 4-like protein A [Micractinium conductrix]